MISAADIHARIDWPTILMQLGIPEDALRNRHGPCPACGGKDRFRFDNKRARGDFFCNQCGAGDGFRLLERVHGWTFKEAREQVIKAAGLAGAESFSENYARAREERPVTAPVPSKAMPNERVRRIRRDCCSIEDCDDAVDYLASRGLWPPAPGCTLRAHATLEYWEDRQRIGRFAGLVADVRDVEGELVTCHVTYLQGGKKLEGREPRKILSPLTDRIGCAVRLMPAGDVLGLAEGIETALSASTLDDVPVWAALNTSLLSRFEPPPGVTTLRIYGDRDEAGLMAALRLFERLQGRIRVEIRVPTAPAGDWNDVLVDQRSRFGGTGTPNG